MPLFLRGKVLGQSRCQGDVFEPDVLAYQTGYSKKYLQVATLLAQQKSYEGIKYVLVCSS